MIETDDRQTDFRFTTLFTTDKYSGSILVGAWWRERLINVIHVLIINSVDLI